MKAQDSPAALGRHMGMPLKPSPVRDPSRTSGYPWLHSFSRTVATEVRDLGVPKTPPRDWFTTSPTHVEGSWLDDVPTGHPSAAQEKSPELQGEPRNSAVEHTITTEEQPRWPGDAPRPEPNREFEAPDASQSSVMSAQPAVRQERSNEAEATRAGKESSAPLHDNVTATPATPDRPDFVSAFATPAKKPSLSSSTPPGDPHTSLDASDTATRPRVSAPAASFAARVPPETAIKPSAHEAARTPWREPNESGSRFPVAFTHVERASDSRQALGQQHSERVKPGERHVVPMGKTGMDSPRQPTGWEEGVRGRLAVATEAAPSPKKRVHIGKVQVSVQSPPRREVIAAPPPKAGDRAASPSFDYADPWTAATWSLE